MNRMDSTVAALCIACVVTALSVGSTAIAEHAAATAGLEKQLYAYNARVASVYDGDTLRLDVDLGFSQWNMAVPIRLAGLDAPEIRGVERPQGEASRDWLIAQIPPGTWVILKTEKDRNHRDKQEKYGRYLGVIQTVDGVVLNDVMIDEGFATAYPMKGTQP